MARAQSDAPLAAYAHELTLCAYCPSLCRDECPVAEADSRDTSTPWGLMSLADHVRRGAIELTDDVADAWARCVGCGACTAACGHDNDVTGVLLAARSVAVQRLGPPSGAAFEPPEVTERAGRWEAQPKFALVPGPEVLRNAPAAVDALFDLCDILDEPSLSLGPGVELDLGYAAWHSGDHAQFARQAARVHQHLNTASRIVVMSAEALHLLRNVYPEFGLRLDAEVMHTTEFLVPLLSGAVVQRVSGRVAYHDACHLSRHLGVYDEPRQLLERVLTGRLTELPKAGDRTRCCGGTGCAVNRQPATAATMASEVIALAVDVGAETLVSFSPECVVSLRAAAGDRIAVEHGVGLIRQAVQSTGSET